MITMVEENQHRIAWIMACAMIAGLGYYIGRHDAPHYWYDLGYHDGLTRAVEILGGEIQ